MYGKILEYIKNNLGRILIFGAVFLALVILVRSCTRNVECNLDARRNRVTIQLDDRTGKSVVKPSKSK